MSRPASEGQAGPAGTAAARFAGALRCLCDGARLMVGVPRYEDYLAHMAERHPDRPPMSYAEFFRDRQAARYGGGSAGGLRCC